MKIKMGDEVEDMFYNSRVTPLRTPSVRESMGILARGQLKTLRNTNLCILSMLVHGVLRRRVEAR